MYCSDLPHPPANSVIADEEREQRMIEQWSITQTLFLKAKDSRPFFLNRYYQLVTGTATDEQLYFKRWSGGYE